MKRDRNIRLGEPMFITNPLTERHLTGFTQLAVLAPLHLLIREDFLQRPGQKHALGFAVFCLRLRVLLLLRWPVLLHLSILLPLLSQAVIFGLVLRISRWQGKANENQAITVRPVELLPQLSAAMLGTRHVTSRDSQLCGFWQQRLR